MSETSRLRIVVKGRVQGVGFRFFTQEQAARLKLSGFVRNLSNGDVELEAEGTADRLGQLVTVIRSGPVLSRVDALDVADLPLAGNSSSPFRVTY